MKTWFCIASGKRLPERGSSASARLKAPRMVHGQMPAEPKLEIWERGTGMRVVSRAGWREEEIADLPRGFTLTQYRQYAASFGHECAMEQLPCCDMVKASTHRMLLRDDYPSDETSAWFEATFGARIASFGTAILACLGVFSFDVIAFEDHLAVKFGYPKDEDGSMADFMRGRFGHEVLARFRRDVLRLPVAEAAAA